MQRTSESSSFCLAPLLASCGLLLLLQPALDLLGAGREECFCLICFLLKFLTFLFCLGLVSVGKEQPLLLLLPVGT